MFFRERAGWPVEVADLKAQIEADDLLFDQTVCRHGFSASMRDYNVAE